MCIRDSFDHTDQTEESETTLLDEPKRLIQDGKISKAYEILTSIKSGSSDNPEQLYLKAVCERYLGNAQEALSTIAELIKVFPRYARAYQERGHLTRYLGPEEAAIRAYEKALELNPTLVASWKNLAEVFLKQGNLVEHDLVRQALAHIKSLPSEIRSVASFLFEGKLFKAERLCRDYLIKHPKHVEAMRLLALIGEKLHILDDAEFLLESALAFEPNNLQVQLDYIGILQKRQKFSLALEEAKRIQESDPDKDSFKLISVSYTHLTLPTNREV